LLGLGTKPNKGDEGLAVRKRGEPKEKERESRRPRVMWGWEKKKKEEGQWVTGTKVGGLGPGN